MFVELYKKVTKFTKPVIASAFDYNGVVNTGCAAFVVIDNKRWY